MTRIEFDYEQCIGCRLCYKACFADVIRWDMDGNRPYAAYPDECAVCTWCELRCPKGCINVIPDYTVKNPEIFQLDRMEQFY